MLLLGGLSLSIGWGIRGNFGHEYGAMIPGALAAMAVVLVSGREDWRRRVAYFGFFGAIGWSFGGSISYMQVIAYTHSGHLSSVIYGFACLFVIGFLWGAMGGAGTALPACLDRRRLTELFGPLIAVFIAWTLQDIAMALGRVDEGAHRHESWWYWYDTDWVAATLAIPAVLIYAVVRGRLCTGTRLVLYSAIGWWAAFAFFLFVNEVVLRNTPYQFRMTPPRGDNWAGATGMTIGILVFLLRNGLGPAALATLISGFIGGLGFSGATLIKLLAMKTGWQTNWHSVLEQTYGFINGIGVAVAMGVLASRTERVGDEPPERRWTEVFSGGFVLLGITYVNLVKNVENYIEQKPPAIPAVMYGLHAFWWFNIGYLALAIAVVWLMVRHLRRPLPLIPTSWLGRGQWLYIVFLWWMVIGNLMRAIPPFNPQRLITEGVIHMNAVLCTLLIVLRAPDSRSAPRSPLTRYTRAIGRAAWIGILGMIVSVAIETGITRLAYGNQRAPHAGLHIRFGPNATVTKTKPKPGQPHP